jgi:long-chain fatty acid transport protein
MKRLFVFLCVSALVFAVASPLMAGGIDNKHQFSAEYMRTLNRNAATDSADAVVYNPAGVVKMDDGFYVNLTGQLVFKDYTNKVGGTEYDQDESDIVPDLFVLYRQDKWGAFGAFTIPGGGGHVDYEDGNATTLELGLTTVAGFDMMAMAPVHSLTDQSLKANSFYYGYTFGGAYQVNDWMSASLGVRYIDAHREAEGSVTIAGPVAAALGNEFEAEFSEEADGWGGIIGVNIAPSEAWNIGLRYETKTSLEFKTDQDKDDFEAFDPAGVGAVEDDAEANRDLPALLALGVSHKFTPDLKTDVNFTYYFNESADWEGEEDEVDNGYDIGIALEYAFMPQLKGSVGYMYTYVGEDGADQSYEEPKLSAHTIAGGLAYEAMPGLNLNFGILKTFYQEETTSSTAVFPNGVELEKDVIIIALGVQYKFW